MELVVAIFQLYTTAKDVAQAYDHVADWVIDKVSKWSSKQSTEVIEGQIAKIARATESDVRRAAEQVFAKSTIPAAVREELIGILLNMSRNIRHRSSFGSMDGSYLKNEWSLGLLLKEVEPIRHQGEPVAPGSPWILKRHLGMGSFGEVWLAENPNYPIPRAYKFFTRDQSGDWLQREQKGLVAILKRLGNHEHVVKFEDVQVDKCQFPFLAFEYLAGGSLEDWIVKGDGNRQPLETAEIIRQIVVGLAAAHAQGIYHRDIKPANVLLTNGPDVRIKIGDFGLSKVTSSKRDGVSQLASFQGVVGTALYLPPEAQQRSVRRKPAQDDVFALGILWYQLAVDSIERPPYDFAERLRAKGIDSQTIGLIERCLAHPDRRFADAREVQAALGDTLPPIKPCLHGTLDVQHLAREYLATMSL